MSKIKNFEKAYLTNNLFGWYAEEFENNKVFKNDEDSIGVSFYSEDINNEIISINNIKIYNESDNDFNINFIH